MRNKSYLIYIVLVGSILFGQNNGPINASLKTAKMLERKGDIDGAISIYESILLKTPNHSRTFRDLKLLYKKNQRYEDGISLIREKLIYTPNDIQLYAELGELFYLNDQLSEAKLVWESSTEKFKNNRSYYRIMVSLYGRYSLDDDLLSLLGKGRENFGQSFMAYEAGIYYQSRRVYDKAMDQYILSLSQPSNQNGIIQRRILLMSDEQDAVQIIEEKLIIASQKTPQSLLNVLSEFYFKQQKYILAFETKKEHSKLDKPNFKEWMAFSNECREENQFKIAIQAYNYILSQTLNANNTGKALLGLAQTFEDQIIPIQESHLIPYFFDNNLFFEDPFQVSSSLSPAHLKSSLSLYDSLLISLPKSPLLAEAYFRLGEIQYRILQDFDQSFDHLNKALKNRPDKKMRLKIILRIADVLLAKGMSADALMFLDKQLKQNKLPAIEQKKILIHFLTDEPDTTLKIVQASFSAMSPIDPSFNDLMELKNILTQYYEDDISSKSAYIHFIKSEWYLRQRKIGDAIKELTYLVTEIPNSAIVPLANLRRGLLHYQLKEYDEALEIVLSLSETPLADRGIILAGQIYESKFLNLEKAIEQYMRILDDYPNSIFSEPIRYHIRAVQHTES
ncbi:MAG: tetratricopeptide repeat protein [Candidatus Marinimicrobia bacterium]|nr:tetratricopeptide repeat protein [Candidatus Neomarinimicrobiota bacterium]MBT3840021.1 tetratricopeptide repeat protein [Candidatus Neomarinimicrobiota bacterium]MBT4000053.1 tetratricopeptide repeat protein [Candidatus Neomarinimicrobiota bacterium]MBT4282148.1 tetratricopeptide repeat protein [Candidatus Neomarinimicrobiota bacterium]MBT4578887.1 tetratricopeptide repeat protein [Candidatus Neomarinimicrobiota bacterium]